MLRHGLNLGVETPMERTSDGQPWDPDGCHDFAWQRRRGNVHPNDNLTKQLESMRKWTRPESWTMKAEQWTKDRKWNKLQGCMPTPNEWYSKSNYLNDTSHMWAAHPHM